MTARPGRKPGNGRQPTTSEVAALLRERAYRRPLDPPPSLMQMARARARLKQTDIGCQADENVKPERKAP